MKKLRCESQADIFGKRDSHQWLVYMMVKWRLPCLENVINTLVWYNNTHISFAINYIALFLQSHPMWVARVPVVNSFFVAIKNASSHPMWVARVPVARSNKFCGVRSLSHPMWVARVPVSRQRQYNTSLYRRTPCGWRECPCQQYGVNEDWLRTSHPMWVARVPVSSHAQNEQSIEGRTPCGWRECPFATPRSNVNI